MEATFSAGGREVRETKCVPVGIWKRHVGTPERVYSLALKGGSANLGVEKVALDGI